MERAIGSPLDPRAEVVRLTARFEVLPGSDGPTPQELDEALRSLREELSHLPGISTGAERTLDELIQAYRPRQAELVDLLRADGEITASEHELLRTYLAQQMGEEPEGTSARVAALPRAPAASSASRPPAPRSVEAVLREYRIQSLREAGLVRARRQITFDEYMALKRYFESKASAATTDATA